MLEAVPERQVCSQGSGVEPMTEQMLASSRGERSFKKKNPKPPPKKNSIRRTTPTETVPQKDQAEDA